MLGAGTSAAAIEVAAATSPPRATLAPYHANTPDMKIDSKDAKDVVITQFSIAPGKSTGWHFHPGPTFIIVTAGTLTRYQANDPTCTGTGTAAGSRKTHFLYAKYRKIVPSPVPTRLARLYSTVLVKPSP